MTNIMTHNGKILYIDGKIATDPSCCCDFSSSSSMSSSGSSRSSLSSSHSSHSSPSSSRSSGSSVSSSQSGWSSESSSSESVSPPAPFAPPPPPEEAAPFTISQVTQDFFNDQNTASLPEFQQLRRDFLAATKNGRCGRCAMKAARRKYYQIIANLLQERNLV